MHKKKLFGDNKGKTDQTEMEFGTHLSLDNDHFSGAPLIRISKPLHLERLSDCSIQKVSKAASYLVLLNIINPFYYFFTESLPRLPHVEDAKRK